MQGITEGLTFFLPVFQINSYLDFPEINITSLYGASDT